MKVLLIVTMLVFQLLASGCGVATLLTMPLQPTKDVRQENDLFEGVVMSGKRMHAVPNDKIIYTNLCPPECFVDLYKGSKLLVADLRPMRPFAVYPSADRRYEPVQFSIVVYRIPVPGGPKQQLFYSSKILNLGGAPLVANWTITKDGNSNFSESFNYTYQQFNGYGYGYPY